jgi:hypothetical protein
MGVGYDGMLSIQKEDLIRSGEVGVLCRPRECLACSPSAGSISRTGLESHSIQTRSAAQHQNFLQTYTQPDC